MADFETTTDPDDCRVWAWALCDVDNTWSVEINNTIESFAQRCAKHDSVIYFHNLGFDGSFIIDWLFREGYSHSTSRTPRKWEFTTLISNMGKFYSLKVRWGSGKITEFRDSLKKLPMSVRAVAGAFKLDMAKGEIDYHVHRPVGHAITAEEREYIRKDVQIVAEALKIQLREGMTKLTVGADSLAEYKRVMGRNFKRLFPILPETMDKEIRRAYRGGFTYADERFRGQLIAGGATYDVNSLYPSVMYNELIPYGEPIFREGAPETIPNRPLFITTITFTARLKPDHIPCIQIKGSNGFVPTVYQTEINDPVTLACTNVDLALWEEHYDLDIHAFEGTWYFKGASGMFTEFIDKWMEVKANSDGGLRTIAKLHLNSLYGKFATNPDVTGKLPTFDDGRVRLVMGDPETRDPVYTAAGVFITAYARDVTIRAAQRNYGRFLYADTDSLHLMSSSEDRPAPECQVVGCAGHPESLNVHPTDLGAWKHEYDFTRGMFARAKAYTEQMPDGELVTHIAGLPDTIAAHVTFDDYRTGRVFGGKLLPKRVPGGIVLVDTEFTLKSVLTTQGVL